VVEPGDEAGHGGNPVDPAQMESIWRENKDVVPMTLEMIVKGIELAIEAIVENNSDIKVSGGKIC